MPSTGYREIAASLQAAIESGALGPGAPVPSEAELARSHGVTRTTARRALAQLEGQGQIVVAVGRGRFVRTRPQREYQPRSKFELVAKDIRDGIASGRYPRESALGTEEALASTHSTSQGTVRRALQLLSAEVVSRPALNEA